jgi:4-alpha-glucanotransferase
MEHGRKSGVLLPVFSLPGPFGIGTLGAGARRFVDFLAQGGQSWWQILPLNPPGPGNSPYMSPSVFQGNPLFLDPEELAKEGLLTARELHGCRVDDPDRVDYDWLRETRLPLLELVAQRSGEEDFLQKEFQRQWADVKSYANENGVSILGDLPIYVSPDGKEVAQRPELFQLNGDGSPSRVAGVPPDAFSHVGQLWGNPLYDWEGHREAVFAWWKERIRHAAGLYDGVRIDHFRGFHTYWSVPADAQDAREGRWERGPGQALVDALAQSAPGLTLIAEDLGDLDREALDFIAHSGLPGMKVLLYAFSPSGDSAYLPHNCEKQAAMYTGTHDTPTFVQWLFQEAGEAERAFALDYLRLREDEGFGWGAVRGAWASPCALAMAPLQDILGLGADARINTPGTMGPHNWSWRVREGALNRDVAGQLYHLTRLYQRL